MNKGMVVVAVSVAMMGAADAQSFGFGTFAASIGSDGSVIVSSGLQSSSHIGTGKYLLTFSRNVGANCVFVASPRGVAGGTVTIVRTKLAANQIQVDTYQTGQQFTFADVSFSVIASCSSGTP